MTLAVFLSEAPRYHLTIGVTYPVEKRSNDMFNVLRIHVVDDLGDSITVPVDLRFFGPMVYQIEELK